MKKITFQKSATLACKSALASSSVSLTGDGLSFIEA
jgi:hypothetical protein